MKAIGLSDPENATAYDLLFISIEIFLFEFLDYRTTETEEM